MACKDGSRCISRILGVCGSTHSGLCPKGIQCKQFCEDGICTSPHPKEDQIARDCLKGIITIRPPITAKGEICPAGSACIYRLGGICTKHQHLMMVNVGGENRGSPLCSKGITCDLKKCDGGHLICEQMYIQRIKDKTEKIESAPDKGISIEDDMAKTSKPAHLPVANGVGNIFDNNVVKGAPIRSVEGLVKEHDRTLETLRHVVTAFEGLSKKNADLARDLAAKDEEYNRLGSEFDKLRTMYDKLKALSDELAVKVGGLPSHSNGTL